MADIIARFKGDTSDLDNKVKKATQTLKGMVDQAHRGDGIFTGLEKAELEFVRSLGSLETGAKSAKGTVAELTQAFTDMSAIYNRLSEEEKRDEGGKALRASLDQLKERIKEGQTELKNISAEISNNGNILDQLSSKLGISTGQFIGWGTAIGAGKVALDTLKDAFFNNENQLDEWGRIVQSSESVYNAFLNSLNNGDISGFLSNIDSIISAARDAYDSLDELGTYNAFNQRNKARNNAGYSEALERYKKNPTADNKKALEEANRKVVADLSNEAQKSEKAYQDALRKLAKERGLNKKEQDRFVKIFSNGSYGDLKNAKAGYGRSGLLGMDETWNGQRVVDGRVEISNGTGRTVGGTTFRDMSASEKERFKFAQALSGVNDTEIKAVQALGAQAEQLNQAIADQNRSFNRMSGNNGKVTTLRTGGGSTTTPKEIIAKAVVTESLTELQILEDQLKTVKNSMKGYGEGTEEWKAMNEEVKSLTEQIDKLNGKTVEMQVGVSGLSTEAITAYTKMLQDTMKSVDLTSPLYQNLQQNLADTNALQNILQTAIQNGIDTSIINAEELWDKILNAEDIPNDTWQSIIDTINAKLGANPIKLNFETGSITTDKPEKEKVIKKKKFDPVDAAGDAVGGVNSIVSGLEGLGVEFGKGFKDILGGINSVMSIVQGINAIVGITHTGLLADIAVNTAAAATASAVDAIIPFHNGGLVHAANGVFVPGLPNGGRDTVPAMLSPGELVLNEAQQQNLAGKLGGGFGTIQIEGVIDGESIRLVQRNSNHRRGRGEVLTSRRG